MSDQTKPFSKEIIAETDATTYSAHIVCGNCGADDNAKIKKGILIKDAIMYLPCKSCGCLTMQGNV
jgi:hypothetical protein